MIRRPTLVALALLAAPLTVLPMARVAASDDPSAVATGHLRADAVGRLTLQRGSDGRIRYVGTGAHGVIDNPHVDRADSVAGAARAHLDRYAAALGAAQGTTYAQLSVSRSVAGTDVVRYEQKVGGVPVLGGEVVVGLGSNHDLRSLAADVAPQAAVTDATVSAADAVRTARGVVSRSYPRAALRVTDLGRWVLDPAVAGLSLPGGTRTVRRLEVGDGAGIRDLVLIDDHTGQVLFRTSLIEHLDRVVCDDNNVQQSTDPPCTSGFARTEASVVSGVTDVNQAFDYAKEVSDFYGTISGGQIDLTTLLGRDVSGVKKLAATVRFCVTGDTCPYANAFWDGTQMYYGQGFAAADDVVGHEMTHGVVDQYSKLFYWGQSGAINESMADVMGEFIDHRNGSDDDSAWNLGEDLPGGALRNMKDPTLFQQPDAMTSSLYTADDVTYGDSAGVHTNSGVGNKTAYLISQGTGGTAFNGQTFAGIDGSDTRLTKTSKLYLDVIEKLPSGADYADLGSQLEQSCADFVAHATGGFTAATCAIVHKATLATQLALPPANAAPAADAPTSCPLNTAKRVLFDSETGDPASKFTTSGGAGTWSRATDAGVSNATSGRDSWFAPDPATIQTYGLTAATLTALPAGQHSYLSFENWYVFDYDNTGYYDGGTVELGIPGSGLVTPDPAFWVNGPNQPLMSGSGNSGSGQEAFAGDSRGWASSRLDLTAYAGDSVSPRFSMRSDNSYGFMGWYLDDIRIYTCDPAPSPPSGFRSPAYCCSGASAPLYRQFSWTAPAVNPDKVTGYRLEVPGRPVQITAGTTHSVLRSDLTPGRSYTVTLRSLGANGYMSPPTAVVIRGSSVSLNILRSGSKLIFSGALRVGGQPVHGYGVSIERRIAPGRWVTVGLAAARGVNAVYRLTAYRRTAATYRVRFGGDTNINGSFSALRRK